MFGRERSLQNTQYAPLHDDEDESAAFLLVHHPNTVLVANHHGECHVVPHLSQSLQLTPHSPTKSSFSDATRRFFQTKLPVVFRKDMAITASFASLHAVIIADLQNGDIPTAGSIDQGWTIVHRRRYRGKNGVGESRHNTKSPVSSVLDLVVDEEVDPSDQVTCSVFVKWEKVEEPYKMTMSPLLNEISGRKKEERHFKDPIPETPQKFLETVESIHLAIENNMQPTRISQGSSGSYFCRDMEGKIVGVFKPKNEEPYGRLNPKWTKWIHRHLFPCFFGRAGLIPNLGYISEAAASLIDRRLGTNIVPYTGVIHLASPSFHYDYLDRRANHIPQKIGSFQCFLTNYKDANVFFRKHPYGLERSISSRVSTNSLIVGRAVWGGCLGNNNETTDDGDSNDTHINIKHDDGQFRWTVELQNQFRREFEQLVILDYLMRNTDRGLDNWMIKYCPGKKPKSSNQSGYSSIHESDDNSEEKGHIHVAAIDNGLAFPYKHPDQWRSYPYGWTAMPDPLVNRPFSEATRNQFLPILTDPLWWRETVRQMRSLFELDDDFDERMFQRQMGVLKGQGFNIIRTLKESSAGPIDLVAMERVVVKQEEILIEYSEKALQSRCDFGERRRNTRSNSLDAISNNANTQPIERDKNRRERVKSRLSVDLGRKSRISSQRRNNNSRGFDSDGDFSEEEEQAPLKKVTIIMERIEPVNSRTYFTCC